MVHLFYQLFYIFYSCLATFVAIEAFRKRFSNSFQVHREHQPIHLTSFSNSNKRPCWIVVDRESLKLRLHTAINRDDFVSCCMLYTYKSNKMHSVRKWRCAFVVNLLNHIHQDTKSDRLIAVCKRTLRPVYKGDICSDLSPFDACDWMDWLANVLDHLWPSYINQYFCDSTTQSHVSEWEKSSQKSLV